MATYIYPTEEAHQRHLAKRREYYQANKDRIRQRENQRAVEARRKNPERYKETQRRYRENMKKKEQLAQLAPEKNPHLAEIMAAIAESG